MLQQNWGYRPLGWLDFRFGVRMEYYFKKFSTAASSFFIEEDQKQSKRIDYKRIEDTFSLAGGIYLNTYNLIKVWDTRLALFFGINALYTWESYHYQQNCKQNIFFCPEVDYGVTLEKIRGFSSSFCFELGVKAFFLEGRPYMGLKIKF